MKVDKNKNKDRDRLNRKKQSTKNPQRTLGYRTGKDSVGSLVVDRGHSREAWEDALKAGQG